MSTISPYAFQSLIDFRLRYPREIHGQGWHEGTQLGIVWDWLLEQGFDEEEALDQLNEIFAVDNINLVESFKAYFAILDDFKNQMALAIGSLGNTFQRTCDRVGQIMREFGYISLNLHLPEVPRNPRKRGRLLRRVHATARHVKHAL